MKIHVTERGVQKINLRLPTGLVLNRITAYLAPRFTKKNDGMPITGAQAYRLIRALKEYKENNEGWL